MRATPQEMAMRPKNTCFGVGVVVLLLWGVEMWLGFRLG